MGRPASLVLESASCIKSTPPHVVPRLPACALYPTHLLTPPLPKKPFAPQAVPQLRSSSNIRQFNSQLRTYDQDLEVRLGAGAGAPLHAPCALQLPGSPLVRRPPSWFGNSMLPSMPPPTPQHRPPPLGAPPTATLRPRPALAPPLPGLARGPGP
jgi:hypothetical protein